MKKIRKEEYGYWDGPVENQYCDIDTGQELYVDARYLPAIAEIDRGNKFIEALPHPRSDQETLTAYHKELLYYDAEGDMKKTSDTRKYLVNQLRELRVPLPFHKQLEFNLNNALVCSYRKRYQIADEDIPVKATVSNGEIDMHRKLLGDTADSANVGFAMLGCSGCGKSSALAIALQRYPQVIFHYNKSGRQPQIVYLAVNCITNSNFSALYVSIGEAIDRALGITTGTYEKLIAGKKNLGEKAEKVRELVELFAVGIIVLDEIQLIDFASTKENSFESLMTLTNRTKVAIAVVGTEDAYEKMFSKLRNARRVGTVISGNGYCSNKAFFTAIVKNLMVYQWFDEFIPVTRELVDALYENTHGIVDQLVSLYMFMNIDYLSKKNRPKVDAEFVYATADRHYAGLRNLLNCIEDPIADAKRKTLAEKANRELTEEISKAEQQSYANTIMESAAVSDLLRVEKRKVIHNIQMVADYSKEMISDCCDIVLTQSNYEKPDEKALTTVVLNELRKRETNKKKMSTTKRRGPATKIKEDVMLKYVLDENA